VKFTLMQVEMDGNDAGAVLRGLTEAMQGDKVAPVNGPVMEVVRALPAPPAPKRKFTRKKQKPEAAIAQRAEPGDRFPSLNEAIRQAVRAGPKSNPELLEFLLAHGVQADSQQVSGAANYLRAHNEIYKRDMDLKWCPAVKAVR